MAVLHERSLLVGGAKVAAGAFLASFGWGQSKWRFMHSACSVSAWAVMPRAKASAVDRGAVHPVALGGMTKRCEGHRKSSFGRCPT